MAINKMSFPLELLFKSREPSFSTTEEIDKSSETQLRKPLITSNQFLINQIDKNKKYIKSLQSVLAWISSCPETVNPELTSLMLSNNQPESSYNFELRLVSEFNKFICKSKYFSFIVELVQLSNINLPNNQKIPIEVKLYTSETLPKPIVNTMQGKSIIRGRNTEHLVYHANEGKFLVRIKMQITEVSSHFVNGTINLVVASKGDSDFSIKPLVIKDLVIKAKEKTCIRWREMRN